MTTTDHTLNRYSQRITQRKSQGASQAMLHAAGLDEADMDKAQVGVCANWYEGNPCNMHLATLAEAVKQGVIDRQLVGFRFDTIGVSDGISMGTEGMSYSLPSRDLIADSIETVMGAQWYDALVALPGCDKNMPGCLMAMARLNRPSIMVYGGTIKPGCTAFRDKDHPDEQTPRDIISAFQSYGESISGRITEDQRQEIVRSACPGPGACGGMYTANTMAAAAEAMGMSLPGSSSTPAVDKAKLDECRQSGDAIRTLLERDLTPRQIMTRAAFENAMVVTMIMGGSTNSVLHLLAIAHEAEVDLTLEDFKAVARRVPLLADMKPSGKYVMEDVHKIGGIPAVLRYLLDHGMIDGSIMTVTGQTLGENLQHVEPVKTVGQASRLSAQGRSRSKDSAKNTGETPVPLSDDPPVVHPIEAPLKPTGHIAILHGNLAPDGAVGKITGKQGLSFTGPARVYDSEEDMLQGLENSEIQSGDVIVIRNEGPRGGPGMPEMLTPTSALAGAGFIDDVALITDGRFSGGSHGFIIAHVCPEAQDGGPIAHIQNGQTITIDDQAGTISVDLSDEDLSRRQSTWTAPPFKVQRGYLAKYLKTVHPASKGCITG